ncbi:7484_t:CDS:2 [Funneliformis geosporum]|uniref:DNA-directed DNA polymerase n=1 Tax=Funneliformis geosporum TaxID=1117311 RepID=A0A9W4SUK6_9GLOM|nr:7484_t:CDS:2 [Funneliformis geosporum]
MTIKNEESTERINRMYRYVLRLYGHLINSQKALVTLKDIWVFFNILVPDDESPNKCKTKIRDILSGSVKTFSVKHIKAFSFSVQDNNFKIASDDLYSFHRKVARENGIQLSRWFTINKYICKKGKRTSSLCPHEFYVSIKDFCLLEDLTTISDQFPILALLQDHTLVLTWDIETQSQKLGEFAEYPVKALKEGEEDLEEKEYIGSLIKIKISAEDDFTFSFLKLSSCCGLDSKADMPYDKIEVASIAYVSLFDTHYRANRMKVQNLFRAYAVKRDIVISTKVPENIEKEKYPGVYVFPPKKGIESRRSVTGLDFASLYPSIIMPYNLFPEKFIFDPKDVNIA